MPQITFADKDKTGTGVVKKFRDVDANEVKTVVNGKADSLGALTALVGTAWDGSPKTLTLSANTALTFTSTRITGILVITQDATGGRTLSLNGTSVPINSGANSKTIISFIYNDVTSSYLFSVDTNIVGVSGGDTTAPVLQTAVVENATPGKLVLTYDEALLTSSVPATSAFSLLIDGVSSSIINTINVTGSTVELNFTPVLAGGEVVTISYAAPSTGKIKDLAGNNAANFSNVGVTNNVAGADADATAFINRVIAASGSLSSPQQDAINTFTVGLKSNGIYTKMKEMWLFVGGNAASHVLGFKNVSNLTLNGTWTHSNAAGSDSTNNANSGILCSALSATDVHLSFYSLEDVINANGAAEWASEAYNANAFPSLRIRNTTSGNASFSAGQDNNTFSNTNGLGFFIGSKVANNSRKVYQNGTAISTNTATDTGSSLGTGSFYLHGAGTISSTAVAFASLGNGLSDSEAAAFNTLVEALQDAFGRGVQ